MSTVSTSKANYPSNPVAGNRQNWPSTGPIKTISGVAVTPDRGDVFSGLGQQFSGLIDLGFAAVGDRLYNTIAGSDGSVIDEYVSTGGGQRFQTGNAPAPFPIIPLAIVGFVTWVVARK